MITKISMGPLNNFLSIIRMSCDLPTGAWLFSHSVVLDSVSTNIVIVVYCFRLMQFEYDPICGNEFTTAPGF